MRAVVDTSGGYVTVSDDEILAAIGELAQRTGVFAEPAAAAAYAGLSGAMAQDLLDPDDRVVVLSTGSGLKDIRAAMKGVTAAGGSARHVLPTLEDLKRQMTESNPKESNPKEMT